MMKKVFMFGLMSLMFLGCASKKNVVSNSVPANPRGIELEVPCKEYGFDDKDYFRAMGTATNANEQSARLTALQSAKAMIHEKIGGFVSGLTSDYSRAIAGDNLPSEKIQRAMEGEMNTLVERMLNDASATCEKEFYNNLGQYQSYIAIEISKEELINNSIEKLSDNEELEIEFNRDLFRKYAEEKMNQLKEARDGR